MGRSSALLARRWLRDARALSTWCVSQLLVAPRVMQLRLVPVVDENEKPSGIVIPMRRRGAGNRTCSRVRVISSDATKRYNIMDAVRVSDGQAIMMKRVDDEDPSEQHMRFFGEEPRAHDPRNHCLPLLDVLRPPSLPNRAILVTRRLVPWDVWPFCRVSEVADFVTQLLEVRCPTIARRFLTRAVFQGLAFMHDHGFAHL